MWEVSTTKPNRNENRRTEFLELCFDTFCEYGLENTSLKMLADACGVTNAALIYYFGSKDNIIIESTAHCMAKVEDDFMARAPKDFADIERFLREMPHLTAKLHGSKYRFMYQVYASPKYREHGKEFFRGVNVRYHRYAQLLSGKLGLPVVEPDMARWRAMVEKIHGVHRHVTIALVGKYTGLHDAYLSVVESLFHAGTACDAEVTIRWVDSETLTPENVEQMLAGCGGVLVPGGFGDRGIEGMILAAQYAREHQVPYLGICLGMQIAVIEFARHVVGWADAHSAEFTAMTAHPVIDLMSDQVGVTAKGGTMRLGKYPCRLAEGSLARREYGTEDISERHRHRYEFNNRFRCEMEAAGLRLSGLSPDGSLVEIVEEPAHRWFVGAQFHPEFKSRPDRPHPLFRGFVQASLETAE